MLRFKLFTDIKQKTERYCPGGQKHILPVKDCQKTGTCVSATQIKAISSEPNFICMTLFLSEQAYLSMSFILELSSAGQLNNKDKVSES